MSRNTIDTSTPSPADVQDDTAYVCRVAEWLVQAGVDHVGMKEDMSHKGPGYVLVNGGIQVHLIGSDDLDAAVAKILAEGL